MHIDAYLNFNRLLFLKGLQVTHHFVIYPAPILHHLSVSHLRGLQSWTLRVATAGNLCGSFFWTPSDFGHLLAKDIACLKMCEMLSFPGASFGPLPRSNGQSEGQTLQTMCQVPEGLTMWQSCCSLFWHLHAFACICNGT